MDCLSSVLAMVRATPPAAKAAEDCRTPRRKRIRSRLSYFIGE
jgi:hypothetical protein